MARIVLLGPQRFRPRVADALRSLGVTGSVAVVTAGWQEREDEVDELHAHVDREVINLELYRRYDEVLARDTRLGDALRQRQDELQELQELYRLRLTPAHDAARALLLRRGDGVLLEEHRRDAIRAVRAIDRQHLLRLRKIHEAFEAAWTPSARPAVTRQRAQLGAMLARSSALCIAGGHVAVLLNRLRLFDLLPLLRQQPIVAWSAGAMVLAPRVVLFHDSPPQGAGAAEVLETGLAACPGIVPLPHASRRLLLGDPVRVALFARRFGPAICAALDPVARLVWDGRRWRATPETQRLDVGGQLLPVLGGAAAR